MKQLRLIGDVHGKVSRYVPIAINAEHSIQIGDMGFRGTYQLLRDMQLDPIRHKFLPGNHDDYMVLPNEFSLPDFGVLEDTTFGKVFFVRGAFSIDKNQRVPYLDYFPTEELGYKQSAEAYAMYMDEKPDIVLSHDGPTLATRKISSQAILTKFGWNPNTFLTSTVRMLNSMLDNHVPKMWVFGHYHKPLDQVISGCRFICLAELQYYDLLA